MGLLIYFGLPSMHKLLHQYDVVRNQPTNFTLFIFNHLMISYVYDFVLNERFWRAAYIII